MFNLRNLPYERDAFKGDFISEKTIEFHYSKHHQAYVNNLNNLVKNTEFEDKSLYEIISNAKGGIYNNAAQIYNHDFYWDCIAPKSGEPSEELKAAISNDFGSLDKFKETFVQSAATLFGSGWCWLVINSQNKLEIVQTSNANTPDVNHTPILVVDVWEHAYYIDYKNLRPKYLEEFYAHINWEFVSSAYKNGIKDGTASISSYINNLHKI